MLKDAVATGWKGAAHFAKDPDLDPLRGWEDFKKLLAKMETKSRPKKKAGIDSAVARREGIWECSSDFLEIGRIPLGLQR